MIPKRFIGENIIHLPTVKTHVFTTTTGAMKNAFGGLLNEHRHWTHPVIHETLVDLLMIQKKIHRGVFAVMDGTFAGDGPGPRCMMPHAKNVLLASADQVAIDAAYVAAARPAPELVGRREGDQAPAGDEGDRSHSSASVTYWVVTSSVRPASRRRWSSSQIVLRRIGSMPAVGSSRSSRSGSWTRAQASSRRRCMPPDSWPGPPSAGVPQVDELEHLADAAPAAPAEHPEQARDEVDVLAAPSGPGTA